MPNNLLQDVFLYNAIRHLNIDIRKLYSSLEDYLCGRSDEQTIILVDSRISLRDFYYFFRAIKDRGGNIPHIILLYFTGANDLFFWRVFYLRVDITDDVESVRRALERRVAQALKNEGSLEIEEMKVNRVLSPSELEVLRLLMNGESVHRIAKIRHRCIKTIYIQRLSITEKFGTRNSNAFAMNMLRHGRVMNTKTGTGLMLRHDNSLKII